MVQKIQRQSFCSTGSFQFTSVGRQTKNNKTRTDDQSIQSLTTALCELGDDYGFDTSAFVDLEGDPRRMAKIGFMLTLPDPDVGQEITVPIMTNHFLSLAARTVDFKTKEGYFNDPNKLIGGKTITVSTQSPPGIN